MASLDWHPMAAESAPPILASNLSTMAAQSKPLQTALASLHYIYPTIVFGYFVTASAASICVLSERREHRRRRPMLWLMLFTVLSYLAQIATVLIPSILGPEWLGQQDTMISLLSCILVFGVQLAMLFDNTSVAWYPFIGPYLLALVFEPALEITTLSARESGPLTAPEIAQLCVVATRYLAMSLVVATYFIWRNNPDTKQATDSEQQPLIPKDADGSPLLSASDTENQTELNYGSTTASASTTADNSGDDSSDTDDETDTSKSSTPENTNESSWERREREKREEMEKRLKENGSWFEYAKRFMIFFPYVWPVNNRGLQIRAVLVSVCLLTNNALNVLIPRQLGIIIDSLGHSNNKNPWIQVMIFAVLKFASSQAGISLLRQWLWIPVEYYSFDAMSTAAYSHVLNLSSDFHDSKSSSDIMMAISSGQSISNLLESVCFSAIPMLIDMVIAFFYLSATFGPYEGFITFATAVVFLYIAGRMISGLKRARRSEVSAWFEEHYVRQAGIQGWSTVASFNQVNHEEQRYSKAVKTRVERSQHVYLGYLLAYAFQYLVLLAGLLAGAFLAVFQVTSGQSTPGQFIMLLTYWTQLVAPLTFFASLGKNISRNFIHAEQLLEIMKTKPTVVSKENAPVLSFTGGSVEFDNVSFSYSGKKKILENVSFYAQPGTTIAFVGATGAGKSTILKLLDRFYDVTEGSIKIDGQDIRDVDLHSLRSRIGIVPQSPILFNDTIMNNVRYAKLDATDEEVYQACQAAAIHEQILGFSEGYETRVGERGIKISGGELQRLAIARAILKSPSIVLLDEATSSVDTETEQKIQKALHALCSGRTTFVVAHRLSTVMNADRIIVVSDGKVVETGSHDDLIESRGKYANLWSKQVFSKPKDKEKATAGEANLITDVLNNMAADLKDTDAAKTNGTPPRKTASNDHAGTEEIDETEETDPTDTQDKGRKTSKGDSTKSILEAGGINVGRNGNELISTPQANKKEDPRLNPIAPSFTPQTLHAALKTSSMAGQAASESENMDAGPSGSTVAINGSHTAKGKSNCRDLASETGSVAQFGSDSFTSSSGFVRGRDISSSCASDQFVLNSERAKKEQRSTEATDIDTLPQELPAGCAEDESSRSSIVGQKGSMKGRNKNNKTKWNRPRYSRQVQSRSEPFSSK